jgi:hypothetical protein
MLLIKWKKFGPQMFPTYPARRKERNISSKDFLIGDGTDQWA